MIFVDTGVWYSLLVPTDPNHQKTAKWFDSVAQPIVTSDYVVDETLTLSSDARRAFQSDRVWNFSDRWIYRYFAEAIRGSVSSKLVTVSKTIISGIEFHRLHFACRRSRLRDTNDCGI